MLKQKTRPSLTRSVSTAPLLDVLGSLRCNVARASPSVLGRTGWLSGPRLRELNPQIPAKTSVTVACPLCLRSASKTTPRWTSRLSLWFSAVSTAAARTTCCRFCFSSSQRRRRFVLLQLQAGQAVRPLFHLQQHLLTLAPVVH